MCRLKEVVGGGGCVGEGGVGAYFVFGSCGQIESAYKSQADKYASTSAGEGDWTTSFR